MSCLPLVLLVEDNESHIFLIEEKLRLAFPNIILEKARNLFEASCLLPKNQWDLVILDSMLPDGQGVGLLEKLSKTHPFTAVAILTEDAEQEMLGKKHHGVVKCLKKEKKSLDLFVSHIKKLMSANKEIHRMLQEEGVSSLAFRDPLTHLYSRAYFDEHLRREVSSANRYGHEFSLLIVDVDGFSKINNRQGSHTGDRCLKRLAAVLAKSVRSGDVVARYGADEFVVLLSHCKQSDAMKCASRVLERLRRVKGDNSFTVSVGITYYHGEQKIHRLEQIISRADQSLTRAKRRGGDCYSVAR